MLIYRRNNNNELITFERDIVGLHTSIWIASIFASHFPWIIIFACVFF